MRTTLTIDDALMQELKETAFREGRSLKEVVNRAISAGLRALKAPPQSKEPYRCPTFSMGFPPDVNLDKALRVADELEADEVARKLTLRK